MRVLYIINAFSWGGAEKLVYDLALSIRPKVETVSVVALYKQGDETELKMMQELNDNSIETMILDKPSGKKRIKCICDLYRYTKVRKINIIHAHCSVPMLFGKVVGKVLKIPVICTIHNTRGYSKRKEIATMWMTNKYISIGKAVEEYMIQELKIPKRKIERIYNAIDVSKFKHKEKTSGFWDKYQIIPGELSLVNVARVNEQKNQLCLLRAAKNCLDAGTNVHVYILGGYDEQETTYRALVNYIIHEGIEKHVTFLGMHQNVNDFLNNADCFVMTSWFEGLSVAFLEAVICGIPIIVTDMPFVKELMEFGKCATVIEQDDDKSLANNIIEGRYFIPDKEVIDAFKNLFSIEEFCNHHLAVYRSFE